ncbi:phenylacetate-CoA ligase [Aequitasia blattaphilus]|uniref:Phenylacetate--CoA ligase n=1 Tax=Aequitasia blattaphilus TaxID=2949332 RepID=A0ABT1EAW5_9FIRM|nr:hypothetical protein [Aequitasia blattaphilus]MCP1102092.1 hypothetical protein [Aequitasia blattaphilus]MCR8614732.1 hypothetical protein [Aequitasia blattaphilus]
MTKIQKKMAFEIVSYAKENSAFYKRHFQQLSFPDFEDLPFTNGDLLSKHGEEMLCTSLGEISRIRTFSTSGSSGTPKRFFFGTEDQERTIRFFAQGMASIAPKDHPVLILMSDDKPGSIGSLLKEGLRRINRKGIIYGRPKDLTTILKEIKDVGCIVGMPSDVYYLCKKAPQNNIPSVLLSADYVSPAIIQAIESLWGSQVFTHYGLTETCYGLAVQCSKGKDLHLRNNDFYTEIIDPDTEEVLLPGQKGEIVLTSLHPSPLPLIRYRTGDIGSLSATPCLCGDHALKLHRVYGRLQNLKTPINIHFLDDTIYALKEVYAYEATLTRSELHLIIDGKIPSISELSKCIGIPLNITYQSLLPWTNSGKRRLTLAHESESFEPQY